MARKTFNVLFFIKKARLLKNGEAPVCMRITVNGCMVDVLVKRSCLEKPRDFDPFGHAGFAHLWLQYD